MSELRQAAVALAEAGFWVFPCRAGTKIPAVEGYLSMRMTPEQVDAWWARHPDHNVALCPENNGLVVLDVDAYKAECNWDRDDVPETMTVRSARGGVHYYFEDGGFRFPGVFNGYEGVDLKHRGVVVLPPSRFEDGAYAWVDDGAPAELPSWMPTRVAIKVDPMAAALLTASRGGDNGKLIEMMRQAENVVSDRSDWLAIGLGLHFEYAGTPLEETARQAWIDWSRRWEGGTDPDTLELDAAKVWDRATPPDQVIASGRTPYRGGTVAHHLRQGQAAPELPPAPAPQGGMFRKFDTSRAMALRPWLIENILREGEIGGVPGGPGTGKTNVTATWIAGMLAGDGPAAGLPRISRPLNVAWVNAEEDVDALDLRVGNALNELGLVPQGQLYTAGQESLIGEGFDGTSLVRVVQRDTVINMELVSAYIAELCEQGADILILDPVTEFNDGEENDRGDRKKLFRAMKTMAREAGLTVLYFAHTAQTPEGKREDWYRGNLYAERGSSAAIGALQFGATLTPMYPKTEVKDHRKWREEQADASNDSVPNVVELLTVKSKMGTAKPNLFYEIRKSTHPMPDGQYLPFAEPLTKEMAMLKIDSAMHNHKDMSKSMLAQAMIDRLGVGVHHSATQIHQVMRGAPGWPDINKFDPSKGAADALLKEWMTPAMVAKDTGQRYRVAMRKSKEGPMTQRFSITIDVVE